MLTGAENFLAQFIEAVENFLQNFFQFYIILIRKTQKSTKIIVKSYP